MDWQLTCRVCLESGDMVSLFDWDENNEQLSDKYTFCCGIEVGKNDTLPTLICLNCVDKLTFAYQFKRQCLTSTDTLKECLEEFKKSSAAVSATNTAKTEMETITIKQENGMLLQYELQIEHDVQVQWARSSGRAPISTVLDEAPVSRKKGRSRKYPNEKGQIALSPYHHKKPKRLTKESEALTTMLANGNLDEAIKEEPVDDGEDAFGGGDFPDDDPDFVPEADAEIDAAKDEEIKIERPKKKGRRRKNQPDPKNEVQEEDCEDVLLRETILAHSEPIPEHILNPKPKKKSLHKKKYVYEKRHTCETCGSSFTSNASLQAHIRRHLGIKPFVCSVCGFSCVTKEALKRHMLRHTGERPYKCRICDRRFGDYGTRQKHERLHMGIRPYQCSLCGKSFTYSYVLANHMLTHTGEKKYSCGPCNKKFTKAHHLKYHNKVHHKDLYLQQQLEINARKGRREVNIISGEIADGSLKFMQHSEGEDQENQMQVVEEQQLDDDDKETDRAVTGMQRVLLDSDFCIGSDDK